MSGRWVMLVASDGDEPAPQVELTWDREVPTPLLVPGLIVGGVLVLGGVIALVLILLADREAGRARRARAEQEKAAAGAVPPRPAGRHREEVPESELTYAQRLGWPGAQPAPAVAQDERSTGEQPTGEESTDEESTSEESTGEQKVAIDHANRTDGSAAGTAGEDGPPLTRRELRERERARQEAERAKVRSRWWPFGAESGGPDASDPGVDEEAAASTSQESGLDPHASGARWRRTWGITQQTPGTAPTGGTPEQDAADTQSIPRQTPVDSEGEENR